jgi:predicted metalloprotease with PDZ domain
MKNNKNSVHISVDMSNNCAHLFNVTMVIDNAAINQTLLMPVWTPGSYMVREFAQHIVSISAEQNGQPILVAKTNKNTFMVENTHNNITITYQVYGFDTSIRAAYLDDRQGFFNGAALFLRPSGLEDARFFLTVIRPPHRNWADAQVASNLKPLDTDMCGFGTYVAESYESLIDHPFQISTMKRLSFNAAGIPHEMVLVGDVRPFDEERLTKDLSRLCETQVALFNGAPFSSYLFIARFEEGGHGGLEHNNSTMLLSSPYCLPKKGLGEADTHYRNFLSLCSHEYFHAWNVKKLKPKNFVRYNLDQECYTTMLWIFEGITSYYDDLLVRRAGLMSVPAYLDLMGKNYTRLLKNKGRAVQSLAESSFDAWIKFYRQNENSLNSSVSYYLKGSFVALYLDLTIRHQSGHALSLDEVMRSALKKYGGDVGLVEQDFFATLREFGVETERFKKDYVYGTCELELGPLLDKFGVSFSVVRDEFCLDEKIKMSAFLGMKLKFDDNDRGVVGHVEQDAPAMRAGLCPFDEIIAVNKTRLDSHNASDLLGLVTTESPVEILYSRKKSIRHTLVTPAELPVRVSKFSLKTAATEQEQVGLVRWLNNSME